MPKVPMRSAPSVFDRLISVATYLTYGMVGFVWLLASFFLKADISHFQRYHIYQSLFFTLTLWLASTVLGICFSALGALPLLREVVLNTLMFFTQTPIYFGFTLVHFVLLVFLAYLSIGALLGKYSYLPFISDVIGQNVGRR